MSGSTWERWWTPAGPTRPVWSRGSFLRRGFSRRWRASPENWRPSRRSHWLRPRRRSAAAWSWTCTPDASWNERRFPPAAGLLLACSALLTLVSYLGYNLSFYQAQGRYLFPALIPLSLAWSLGLRKALHPEGAATIGLTLALGTMLGAIQWLLHTGSKWWVAVSGLGMVYVGMGRALPACMRNWLFAAPYLLLALLCVGSPFWFIIPYLAP